MSHIYVPNLYLLKGNTTSHSLFSTENDAYAVYTDLLGSTFYRIVLHRLICVDSWHNYRTSTILQPETIPEGSAHNQIFTPKVAK